MPKRRFTLFGKSFTLNNGPFNMKEHTIIVVMANVNVASESSPFAMAQRLRKKLILPRWRGICHGYPDSAKRILWTKFWMGIQHSTMHNDSNDGIWSCRALPQGSSLARYIHPPTSRITYSETRQLL